MGRSTVKSDTEEIPWFQKRLIPLPSGLGEHVDPSQIIPIDLNVIGLRILLVKGCVAVVQALKNGTVLVPWKVREAHLPNQFLYVRSIIKFHIGKKVCPPTIQSEIKRADLLALHGSQAAQIFPIVCEPPFEMGMT